MCVSVCVLVYVCLCLVFSVIVISPTYTLHHHHHHHHHYTTLHYTTRHYKPWEKSRKKNEKFEWTAYKSHTRKSQPTAKDYITSAINESGKLTFKVVDFHEKYAGRCYYYNYYYYL